MVPLLATKIKPHNKIKREEAEAAAAEAMKLLKGEVGFLILYAAAFYAFIIHRSLQLSRGAIIMLSSSVCVLDASFLIASILLTLRFENVTTGQRFRAEGDVSDAQWRNFRGNFPVLTGVFTMFTLIANLLRTSFHLKARGMSIIWILISFTYLAYLHGAWRCSYLTSVVSASIIFILAIASMNFLLVKIFARTKYFPFVFWIFNIFFLLCNRVYEGYSFSIIGQRWAYLDNFRGTFRWHICFNFVVLRMISFGYDYHWAHRESRFDHKETGVQNDMYAFTTYLAYLVYAPLYLTGPIVSFNAFASQLDVPQNNFSAKDIAWYGLRWVFSLLLMELMTHLFYYNAFAIRFSFSVPISGMWKELYPMDVFIIGYGVLIFMWLKFFLIWRYFRFWSLICGIEVPENMPRCINNCYNLETFWKNWHASYNKWLVRYLYIPLGGTRRKLLNVWVVFTFVAIWHDLEWKLLSWAWLTCLFFIPEMILKSATNAFQGIAVLALSLPKSGGELTAEEAPLSVDVTAKIGVLMEKLPTLRAKKQIESLAMADAHFQVKSTHGEFVVRELSAVAGAITITCLMVANLVGFVIGPSGISWLISQFLKREGLPVLAGMLLTFYVGTKLMFHIRDAKQSSS
ncbi:hypothetical protein DVH24_016277 [Malus domestica]|uniref:Membrane-bound O-acyltransferase C24H6.01c n=1 Tax=Malus domestica TaxID=3750 RepID=A0A498HVB5_MALDO|nr:hypothetical protein DVH24_016277 [Malus domestica]